MCYLCLELARGATSLVKMENNQTILQNPKSNDDIKAFTFDRSYWSAGDKMDSDYADQETVYNDVGREWLDHAFAGYNCCIFACKLICYWKDIALQLIHSLSFFGVDGQTGSGKSYSMVKPRKDSSIITHSLAFFIDGIWSGQRHHSSHLLRPIRADPSTLRQWTATIPGGGVLH